jgi:protease I
MPSQPTLSHHRFLILLDQDYEDLEYWYPKLRLLEAGAKVVTAGPRDGLRVRGKHGYPAVCDALIPEMDAADFHGIVIPGGWAPDKLRRDPHVLKLVRDFHSAGKLIAAICHGGWIPVSAGVYRGVRVTGSPGIKDDLVNAGGLWDDAAVVVDRHFVSSRRPDDLPDFCKGMFAVMEGKR